MRIVVVDDSRDDAKQLTDFLEQYQREKNTVYQLDVYNSSVDFLEEFKGQYDVIFLDIEMPGSDGLETAREIRQKDKNVGIIFVTNMAQYAVNGYEVDAIDFMVKPVGYYNFTEKLEKAFRYVQNHNEKTILLTTKDGIQKLVLSEIYFIEKERDYLVFHSKQGIFKQRGSMKELKEKLTQTSIIENNSGCLTNLDYVNRIGKETVSITTGEELPLSRRLKKSFTQSYMDYMGGI